VCSHDLTVRFLNHAIAQLIGGEAACTAEAMHGLAVLRRLGVDEVAAMEEIASQAGWDGVTSIGGSDGLGPRVEMRVTVEPFHDTVNAAGWLITARTQVARPLPTPLSDQQLIALSSKLTARECEVMLALQEGASNKVIALRLAISPRTVEFHRARIMQRFAAKSVVDLVRKITSDTQATM
jgi:DNA-binding CsgD family transcriptional regulator